MAQGINLRALAIIALLLPGLAMAAPVAGPCGLCESGLSCPDMEQAGNEVESSSCCGGDEREDPQKPSTGTIDCDCGREAPLATAVGSAPAGGSDWLDAPLQVVVIEHLSVAAPVPVAANPAPPPTPDLFLIDCAFLT